MSAILKIKFLKKKSVVRGRFLFRRRIIRPPFTFEWRDRGFPVETIGLTSAGKTCSWYPGWFLHNSPDGVIDFAGFKTSS